jgi:hypothetical protein
MVQRKKTTDHEDGKWCLTLLHKKIPEKLIAQKLATLETFAKKSFPENGCFNMKWLASVIQELDKLWYDGKMLPSIYRSYGGLQLYVDSPEEKVAGYVLESADKSKISLHINRDLFASLFKKEERGYHSGGILCEDRLICLLHVLLHETVHLVLTLCDKLGYRPDIRDHGKEFNKIVKNLFGQTDPQHGLIVGFEQFHDLDTIRKNIKEGSRVEVFMDGEWVPGKVTRKGSKWVKVDCGKHGEYTVHAGLLRIPHLLKK